MREGLIRGINSQLAGKKEQSKGGKGLMKGVNIQTHEKIEQSKGEKG